MPIKLFPLRQPGRPRRLAMALGLAALLVSSGCAVLDAKQREWIFQPSDRSWPGANTAGMENVWIDMPAQPPQEGKAARLHGLWMPAAEADAPVLLYLHGARWNVAGSSPRIRRLQELGFSVLAIDYRGFGQSSAGLPSETSATEDARAAWDWLGRHAPGQPRYLFGHSLGGAIAIDLASQVDDEAGVMVEATFTSIPDVVRSFRWGWLPVGPLITQRFASIDKVAAIGSPLLVVHGSADPLIPAQLGRQLFDAAREPKRFLLIEGGNHHNTQSRAMAQYQQALVELFGLPAPGQQQARAAIP
jgi:alpha-beta hydrolase superfamily lysophospholipase